jgi:hypothetical protein
MRGNMKLRIASIVLALSCAAFAQDAKPATPVHEHSARADAAEAKEKDCCCKKKMMHDKDASGMKMDGDKDKKAEPETKSEKKSCC